MKLNCWEFMKCGRELDGERMAELWICPAYTESRLDGVHGGTNAGRACWLVTGTLCDDRIQGVYEKKQPLCSQCAFYRAVHREEGMNFIPAASLLKKLDDE